MHWENITPKGERGPGSLRKEHHLLSTSRCCSLPSTMYELQTYQLSHSRPELEAAATARQPLYHYHQAHHRTTTKAGLLGQLTSLDITNHKRSDPRRAQINVPCTPRRYASTPVTDAWREWGSGGGGSHCGACLTTAAVVMVAQPAQVSTLAVPLSTTLKPWRYSCRIMLHAALLQLCNLRQDKSTLHRYSSHRSFRSTTLGVCPQEKLWHLVSW